MEQVVVIFLCLIATVHTLSKKVVINDSEEMKTINGVLKELETLTDFEAYDEPKKVENFTTQLDQFGYNLASLASAFASLKHLWTTSEYNNQTRKSMLQMLDMPSLIENKTSPHGVWAEKQLYENSSVGVSPKNISSFTTPKDDFQEMTRVAMNDIDIVKRYLTGFPSTYELPRCYSSSALIASDLLNAYVEDVAPMNRWANMTFMSELYDRLQSLKDNKETARHYAQLILYRAMMAGYLSLLCVGDETYPMSESAALAHSASVVSQLKRLVRGLNALVMALDNSTIGTSISNGVQAVLKERQTRANEKLKGITDEQQKVRIYAQQFTNVSKTLWENLNRTHGKNAEFSVHLVWKAKEHVVLGDEYSQFETDPFVVYVHWTPKSREIDDILERYGEFYKTLNYEQEKCQKDTSATEKTRIGSADKVAKVIHDIVRLITDNKVPFVLVADEIYENYGPNSIHKHVCIPYDVVIGA